MNVYDFDETIYDGDSTRDFYFFCLRRRLRILLLLPAQLAAFLKYIFGLFDKTQFKERFYRFMSRIPDIDREVSEFWSKNERKIKAWYKETMREDDLIISASPRFLLEPVCNRLIASEVDKKTGKYSGENCYAEEKRKRFLLEFPKAHIEKFYSDSFSDEPLAKMAEEAFVVCGDRRIKWEDCKKTAKNKLTEAFLSREFIAFLIVGCINTLNGFLFSSLFSLFLNANVAFVCGYIVSLTIAFLLNSKLIFKQCMTFGRYLKFCVSYIPNFLIQNACVAVLYNYMGLNRFLVYALAAIIGLPLTFLLVKLFAFGRGATE